ncbi:unnamed protein product [Bursaphelenchus xylophilus]|uniref:(pine wood nematode) hypothetical protein n=1 Tax=Bursaphelenchus xylophilus TaxID=6326 RepID=A0A1I7RJ11_BURXY|nr:unnamed protein product [Bursaphelenchus xylophilus]CAG9119232.1 unnamed protein product [Bursaphelenchus xylophilus]
MPEAYEYVGCAFAAITFPFYCLLLEMVRRFSKETSRTNSFYFILLLHGYIDLVSLLNNIIFYTLSRWGVCPQFYMWAGEPFLRIGFFLSWACNVMQAQATLLLGINRFTAIVYSQRHSQWWTSSRRAIAAFIILPGVVMGGVIMFSDMYYVPYDHGGVIPKMVNKALAHIGFGIAGLLLILYCLALIFMYLYIWYVVRQHRFSAVYKVTDVPQTVQVVNRNAIQRRREKKLLIMSALICATQVAASTFLVYKFTHGKIDQDLSLYNFFSTVYSAVNPYFVIAFSDVIRQRLVEAFTRSNKGLKVEPHHSSSLAVIGGNPRRTVTFSRG